MSLSWSSSLPFTALRPASPCGVRRLLWPLPLEVLLFQRPDHSLGQPRWKGKNWTHFYFYYHRTSVFLTDFEKEPTRYYLNILLKYKKTLNTMDVPYAQSCPTLCHPMDCRLPGFSVHGIFQARILQWVAIPLIQGIFLTQGLKLHFLHCMTKHEFSSTHHPETKQVLHMICRVSNNSHTERQSLLANKSYILHQACPCTVNMSLAIFNSIIKFKYK